MVCGHFRAYRFIPAGRAFDIRGMRMSGSSSFCGLFAHQSSLLLLLAFERWISQAVGCSLNSPIYSGHDEWMNNPKLSSWSRVLLEKLTGPELVKKFPAFYGNRKFITAFTSARHLSLIWARASHSISWISILILSFYLRLCLPSGLLSTGLTTKTLYKPPLSPHVPYASPISFWIDHANNTYRLAQTILILHM